MQGINLYHSKVWLPLDLHLPDSSVALKLYMTNHAEQEAKNDYSGDITGLVPRFILPENWDIIEVEAVGTEVTKVLYQRQIANTNKSLTLVVRLKNKDKNVWAIQTLWTNDISDGHITLDTTPYQKQLLTV